MTDKDFEKLKELNKQMKEIELFNDEFLQKNKELFEPYTDCLISKEKVLLMLSDLLEIANKEKFTVYDTINHAYEWVKIMPTAYDIDKVVKELFEPCTDCLISKEKVLLMLSDLLEIANKEKFTVYDTINHAYEWVKIMPTAYDIDKVVKELEKLQDKAFRVNDEIVEASIYVTEMMGKAIEIVKNGGK